MIIVRLKGGLGNQLFQYAFGKSLEKKYGQPVSFDTSKYVEEPARRYELGRLKLTLANTDDVIKFHRTSYEDKVRRKFGLSSRYRIAKELPTMEWTFAGEMYALANRHLYFDGYWQNPSYLEVVGDQIRLSLSRIVIQKDLLAIESYSVDRVAVHVRRGDYVSNPLFAGIYKPIAPTYYHNAMNIMRKKLNAPLFHVFSDDIDWCKAEFNGPDIAFMTNSESPLDDLLAMSRMSHEIIANSTFSWWAAWLNRNPLKLIISPNSWYYDKKTDERSSVLIPIDWLRI